MPLHLLCCGKEPSLPFQRSYVESVKFAKNVAVIKRFLFPRKIVSRLEMFH